MSRTRSVVGAVLVPLVVMSFPAGPLQVSAAEAASPAERLAVKINEARAAHGVRPLRPARPLARSAAAYASFMLRYDYFGHLSRIRASRRFSRLGEVIAHQRGRRARPGRTVRQWMGSASHRSLLLSPEVTRLGAGLRRGRLGSMRASVWVVHLGRR